MGFSKVCICIEIACLAYMFSTDSARSELIHSGLNHLYVTDPKQADALAEVSSIGAAKAKDIHYYLYTRNNLNNPDEIFIDNVTSLTNSHFIRGAPTNVLTHGFNGNLQYALFPAQLNSSYLNDTSKVLNVILVDWSIIAKGPDYIHAVYNVPFIGQQVAKFLEFLIGQNATTLDNLHLVGHSLGAHISGSAGYHLNQTYGRKVARISGLDPAKPLFEFSGPMDRIDPSDANLVDIIHTTGVTVGLLKTLGHVDFYPNSGVTQPGCFIDLGCDHSRAHEFFSESVLNNKFKACKCTKQFLDFINCRCNGPNSTAYMGEYVSPSARGIFYLETNSKPPYAKG